MIPEENDSLNEQENPSQTGPNELNEEDLGLSESEGEEPVAGSDSIADNDQDTMEDPVNDLDDDEVQRLFPGAEDPGESADLDDLNRDV